MQWVSYSGLLPLYRNLQDGKNNSENDLYFLPLSAVVSGCCMGPPLRTDRTQHNAVLWGKMRLHSVKYRHCMCFSAEWTAPFWTLLEKHSFLEIIFFAPSFHFSKSYWQWKLETLFLKTLKLLIKRKRKIASQLKYFNGHFISYAFLV